MDKHEFLAATRVIYWDGDYAQDLLIAHFGFTVWDFDVLEVSE